jgi:preprotein translocase subunit SecY
MLQSVVDAFRLPDLRRRILFTLGMLMIFRLIAHIPAPNVNPAALGSLQDALANNQLAQLLNLFAGGALQQLSVASMGVYPYITATIITQLLQPLIPALADLQKEGEQGRMKLNRINFWLTVPLAYLQAYGQTNTLNVFAGAQQSLFRSEFNIVTNFFPTFTIITTMVAGTMLLIWLGEQIQERGIGNGISIIIFAGIVSTLPSLILQTFSTLTFGAQQIIGILVFLVIALFTIVGIVLVQQGERRVQVQYAKQMRGNRMYGGQTSFIPLKVNMAGMIPLIFAQSIIIFPGTVASYFCPTGQAGANAGIPEQIACFTYRTFSPQVAGNVQTGGSLVYSILLFLLVVGFTYFYTMVIFNQQNIPDTLRRNGGFIPGMRPGKRTEDHLSRIIYRITLVGALFLGLVAVLPFITQLVTRVQIGLSATALLIVVGVAIDTMKQIEAQLLARQYSGFIKR